MLSIVGCSSDDSSTEGSGPTSNAQTSETTETTETTQTSTDTSTSTGTGTDSDGMTTTAGMTDGTTEGMTTSPTTGETTTSTTTEGMTTTSTTTTTTDSSTTDATDTGVDPDCMGDPYCTPGEMGDQCLADEFGEIAASLMGFDGVVCSPGPCACPEDDMGCQKKVDAMEIELNKCPTVDGVSASAQCALTVSVGMGPGSYKVLHCLLICQLDNGDDDCPVGATCEDAMQNNLGICLFPAP